MPEKSQPSPEVQLYARMRLQRVVFSAFAIVLVTLFALGLSAYRRMQSERDIARMAEADALAKKSLTESRAAEIERERQQALTKLQANEHELALSQCRLAMAEIRDGGFARAAQLLEEAESLGLPPWSAIVRRLAADNTARFSGSDIEDVPIIAGAISDNGSTLAVARYTGSGVVVETWGTSGGDRLHVYAPAMPVPDLAIQQSRLLLNRDGSEWFLPLPGVSFHGSAAGVVPVYASDWAETEPVRDACANDSLTTIYVAADRVYRFELNAARQWSVSPYRADDQAGVSALCMVDGVLWVANAEGVFREGDPGPAYPFETEPEHVALSPGTGVVLVGTVKGDQLTRVALSSAGEVVAQATAAIPDPYCEGLKHLRDGTLAWIGRSGRTRLLSFRGSEDWTLGGYTLSFLERHPQGFVFANRRGELSVRVQDSMRLAGMPLYDVPPDYPAEARAHGFIVVAPEGVFAVQKQVVALGRSLSVALAPQGASWREGELLRLPGGRISEAQGVLLGAMPDGSVILHDSPSKLKLLSEGGVIERLLPADRVPEGLVVAAEAPVAAMRLRDSVYVTDFSTDPEPVANRMQAAPDMLALDARGRRLAIVYGATVVVRVLGSDQEFSVRTGTSALQVALVFGGSVLVANEGGELVYYEVETGRELLRAGAGVSSFAAAGDASLNIAAEGRLYRLDWVRP